jgi:hypothetical protein
MPTIEPAEALATISAAEQALQRAEDIIDILDLQEKCRGIEALVHAIDAGYELEQRATIMRLRCERKAGSWLAENVRRGNPELLGEHTFTLGDVGITRWQSSRWQAYAKLDEEKFNGWIDENLAKGWDVSAAGLYRYAMNSHYKKHDKPTGQLVLDPKKGTCALRGFLLRCDGPITGQHIISYQMARGNITIHNILKQCDDEIMADCCYRHNVGKMADAPAARKVLLLQKVHKYGWGHMQHYINIYIGQHWKLQVKHLTLEGMLDVRKPRTA